MSKEKDKEELKDELETNESPKVEEHTDNFRKLYEQTLQQVIDLELKLVEAKAENEKNVKEFQEKAKTFSTKAQDEVNRIRAELHAKAEEEKLENKKYGSQKLLESIIDPLINIEQAVRIGKNNEAVAAYVIGFEMLLAQLFNELESFGASKISPKVGDEFDPKLHYALSTKEGKEHTILEVKKDGLRLHDRVIKPATVIIGK